MGGAGRSAVTPASKVEDCLRRLYTVPKVNEVVPLRRPKARQPSWQNPSMRTFNRHFQEEKMALVRESYETFRPLTTAELPKGMHPRWKFNELGEKLTKTTYEHVHRWSANAAWDVHRPMATKPAPWAHNIYPRAHSSTAYCMSASNLQ